MLWLVVGLSGLSGCFYFDFFGEYARGSRWYYRTRYDLALNSWEPLAKSGDCDAQLRYGLLYFQGMGVQKNYITAIMWWTKAANQGQPRAQIALGDLYYQGPGSKARCSDGQCGVERDLVTAYMWYRLGERFAYSSGGFAYSSDAKEALKLVIPRIRREMTKKQIEKSEKLVEAWQPSPSACKPRDIW